MSESMKIRNLKNYGIPSHIVNIWGKDYPPYLLPLQEEAVRNYGILNCGEDKEGRMQYAPTGRIDSRFRGNDIKGSGNDREEGSTGLPRRYTPRNDNISPSPYPLPSRERGKKNINNNLLVIAPTSSGKTFIGEMAAIAQAIHLRKTIYLVPLRALADEKYRHFKNLYSSCGIDIVISTRDREDYITLKKTHLLYDWVEKKKSVKTIEEEYGLYRGCIYRLGEGFSWLADSLSAIAESLGWEKKYSKDLNKIKMLSYRLSGGVQEEGLNLALLYIPGLSRYYIRKLVGAGYGNVNSLRDASEGELGKLLPKRLVQRILKRMKEDNNHQTVAKEKWIVQDKKCEPVSAILPSPLKTTSITSASHNLKPVSASSPSITENFKPKFVTILEIDRRHTDRIIFEGKKIEVTATEFSLIHLLAQNRGKILTHNDLLTTIWKESEDATYIQITYHLYKIRRDILKIIGNNKKNKKRVKDILKVISRRGIMLNLEEDKLKIS